MNSPATRSARRDVRNPLLALPAARTLTALPASQRAALAAVLQELAADAGRRAQDSWRRHKAPMAVYWKACSVYARHIARVLRAGAAPDGAEANGEGGYGRWRPLTGRASAGVSARSS